MSTDRLRPAEESVLGVVKSWREEKCWGVISSDAFPSGRDAFAHFSVVDLDGFRSLTEGQTVEFTFHATRQDGFDFIADWVRAV